MGDLCFLRSVRSCKAGHGFEPQVPDVGIFNGYESPKQSHN
jgi:hypothetical protein